MELKEYFQQPYQGGESFMHEVIFPIFGEEYFYDCYNAELLEQYPDLMTIANATGIKSICHIGDINGEFHTINIFDITVNNHVIMNQNRVAIQKLVRKIMDTYSSVFMIFHYEDTDNWDWRFTFCSKKGNNDEMTDPKRYTFLLGPNQSCKTASENFMKLYEDRSPLDIYKIKKAFDVEALSDEFFDKYKEHYEKFVEFITGKRYIKKLGKWVEVVIKEPHPQMYKEFNKNDKLVRDYVKKMLGRIVFLHFLQKKGWMGVEANKEWGDGKLQFMKELYDSASDNQKDDYLDSVLEPLFVAIDTNRKQEGFLYDTRTLGKLKVPYLNGGLFSRDKLDDLKTKFPSEMFEDLFEFLYQYNFTIDENDPSDSQVGIDPEMLGRIFENLLEDNKDKGAYYTPKEIVKYMCIESLKAYLLTDISDEETKKKIGMFVEKYDVSYIGGDESELAIKIDSKLKDVKICDPAIGSGAFPMGLLKELFYCRGAIEHFDNAAEIKRHIIQNNIYGVDIDNGAVEIARLRFWLSLIIDEKTPETLPNLDFKIMQGNSLLEQYNGVDLSTLLQKRVLAKNQELSFLDNEEQRDIDRFQLQAYLKSYYNEDNRDKKEILKSKIHGNILNQLHLVNIDNIGLENIDIAGNADFFLWHTWFHDVFSRPSKQGFDIVIGNPPYIQLQNNSGELAKIFEKCGYDSFERTGDLYCLFYECGWQLLKYGGHLCFITSNKWMRANYGKSIRKFFAEKTNPILLIDFAGVKIFESATVDTNILLFSKENNKHKTVSAVMNKQNKDSVKNLSVFVEQNYTICDFPTTESWVVLSPIEQSIKSKIESFGTPLKDWDIQINYGIKTGYNEAFIISTEKREEILANCQSAEERQRTAELIRPILRGRDIKRYGYEWADLWLIATFPSRHYNIENFPSVKESLLSYGIERLEQTGNSHIINGKIIKSRKKTNNKWFETQDSISYWEDFNRPKIIYPNMTKYMPFVYDTNHIITNQKCFIITGNNVEYLTAFFNSSLFKFCFRNSFPELQGGTRELSKIFFEKLPIKKVSFSSNEVFKEVVTSIQQDYIKLKAIEIDSMIFDLYNLNTKERNFICRQVDSID